jgi:hypothetical protein
MEPLDQWAAVVCRAEARLRERPSAACWIAVRRYPTFGDWRSYTLGETKDGWRLERRIWRQFVDHRKLDHSSRLELTFEETSAACGAEVAADVVARLSKVSLSLNVGPSADRGEGERCELEVHGGLTDMCVAWAGLPEAWRPMELVFVDVERRLEAAAGGAS